MNTILELLLTLTVAGSAVMACLLLLRLVPTKVLPTRWRYRLSKLAVVFYLLPLAIGVQWIPSFFTTSSLTTQVNEHLFPVLHSSVEQLSGKANSEQTVTELTISANLVFVFLCVWVIGIIAYLTWQTYVYRRLLKMLESTRSPIPHNSEAVLLLPFIKESLGIKSNIQLAYSSGIRSPVLVGLWSPTIYLPVEKTANVDMSMVIRHELIHLKRKDLWFKAFTLGASALHWFNPLVHLLRKDIHTWSELSCDEEVVREMSYAERKRYGETILNVVAGSRNLPVQFCASLSGDGKQLKRRLEIMLNTKKLKKSTIVLTTVALITVGAVGTTTAVWASNNTPKIETIRATNSLESNFANDFTMEIEETAVPHIEHEEFVKKIDLDNVLKLPLSPVSVKLSDEHKFTPEEWQNILSKIEIGEIHLEDE
ncbi:M56 family metallopeptidase [Bacillus horti]|uniref:Beta-lactamase regulating signal transducer with metallopeptidase domain n=1 Tax=Caldalkalibacillus horti TaxID=77523 RepID=A0ABT9W458_9BACI|nr:M56 family metallopeptidase [Bacillus horti]MDQ0168026.1 beta-lactamase regulating signal transducer with metallopeptidase domain [Bacillus horti]